VLILQKADMQIQEIPMDELSAAPLPRRTGLKIRMIISQGMAEICYLLIKQNRILSGFSY
jgi:hypothetical protein